MINPEDLPYEISSALQDDAEEGPNLDHVSSFICDLRDEAIDARKSSGIEAVWRYCVEAYSNIDDANRSLLFGDGSGWIKPANSEGSTMRDPSIERSNDGRSKMFFPITKKFVNAGAAKLSELTITPDDDFFDLKPTPEPTVIEYKEDKRMVLMNGIPLMHPDNGEPLSVDQIAKDKIDELDDKAKKAKSYIHDWLVESDFSKQMRDMHFDMALLGTGVIKGPFPDVKQVRKINKTPEGLDITMAEMVYPKSKRVDPWNFFPDASCIEDIQEGQYVFERDYITKKGIKALKQSGAIGYIDGQLDKVLQQDPDREEESESPGQVKSKKPYTIWYFTGEIPKDQYSCVCPDDEVNTPMVFCHATLINNVVVRLTRHFLDSKMFPYHVSVWKRRVGHWAGEGPAEQLRDIQEGVNASGRELFNNGGISSGAIVVIDRDKVEPMVANEWRVGKGVNVYWSKDQAVNFKPAEAFQVYDLPNRTPQLMNIFETCIKLAEEATNIPLITQGLSGTTTPETFSGMQLQNNTANQLLKDVSTGVDNSCIKPLINMYYEWLLIDPEIPDDAKGDFTTHAMGGSVLAHRGLQTQALAQLGAVLTNPVYGKDPVKWVNEYLKSIGFSPKIFDMTEEQLKQAQSQQAPDPRVQAEQIRAQTVLQKAGLDSKTRLQVASLDTDRDTKYVQALTERSEADLALGIEQLKLKKETAILEQNTVMLKLAHEQKKSLSEIKAELAKVTMQEQTKREMGKAEINFATMELIGKDSGSDINPPSIIRDEISQDGTP